MGTFVKEELSKKNKYWISRHRYYELKHFCLQYPYWKQEIDALSERITSVMSEAKVDSNEVKRTTEVLAEDRSRYIWRIRCLESALMYVDSDLGNYIFRAVTENLSYTYLKEKMRVPCCKDVYYENYRKFFFYLDKIRN